MIGNALRVEIERNADRFRATNPLLARAREGTLGAAAISRYLTNIRELLKATPPSLMRARDRARSANDEALADFYAQKLGEEIGHDEWATNDLERVSSQTLIVSDETVMPSIGAIIEFQCATIDEDPALYLAYTLFAEYVTVLLGPSFLEYLATRCGIPQTSMSVVAKHAITDQEHVEETLDSIDELVGDPRKLARMREILERSIQLFERFCAEVTQPLEEDGDPCEKSVSAA
jgi:hypothetical protein